MIYSHSIGETSTAKYDEAEKEAFYSGKMKIEIYDKNHICYRLNKCSISPHYHLGYTMKKIKQSYFTYWVDSVLLQ